MLDGYHQSGAGYDKKRRILAVNAALEIIKANLAAPANAKNTDYDLEQAAKHIAPLADAIQSAIGE